MDIDDDMMNEPIQPPQLQLNGGPSVLDAYKGKSIAIVDGDIRASGDTAGDCVDAIRKLGIALESVNFFDVPRAAFVG
jgi:hypothetical protein